MRLFSVNRALEVFLSVDVNMEVKSVSYFFGIFASLFLTRILFTAVNSVLCLSRLIQLYSHRS